MNPESSNYFLAATSLVTVRALLCVRLLKLPSLTNPKVAASANLSSDMLEWRESRVELLLSGCVGSCLLTV